MFLGLPRWAPWCRFSARANRTFTVFTDEAGYYTATGLLPGSLHPQGHGSFFLPALREKIGLRPGASLSVNITLSTLLGRHATWPDSRRSRTTMTGSGLCVRSRIVPFFASLTIPQLPQKSRITKCAELSPSWRVRPQAVTAPAPI